jgi:hypothetical protein
MKQLRVLLASLGGLVLTMAMMAATTPSHQPAQLQAACDRYVLGIDTSDSGDCSDEQQPCRTIQYAIDRAVSGDVICVAKHSLAGPLVYAETLVITKAVTLDGAWEAMCVDPSDLTCSFTPIPCDPRNVTIDAERAGRVISISGTIAPTIDCFTITGGDAAGLGGDPGTVGDNDAGGGIYSRRAAPTIVHNVITDNHGCGSCCPYGRGGGIYLLNAPLTTVISGNLIANNVADNTDIGHGGGIMLRNSDAQVTCNTVEENVAGQTGGKGGGIAVEGGVPTIADNVLAFNRASEAVLGLGGGIHVAASSPMTIERNALRYNVALGGPGDSALVSAGGGIYYTGTMGSPAVAIIRDNVFEWNLGATLDALSGNGGGMALHNLSAGSVVRGNELAWNRGCDNCRGRGGGVYAADSELAVTDNVFSHNTATWSGPEGEGGAVYVKGGVVAIDRNEVISNTGAYFRGHPIEAAGAGGGIATRNSQVTVERNRIAGNHATNSDGLGRGGGIYADSGSAEIDGNTIAENHGSLAGEGWGGGIHLNRTRATLDGNVIVDNQAADISAGRGGGVRISECRPFTLTNNIIARNGASARGSGIAVASGTGQLVHNTMVENRDGDGIGIVVGSSSNVALINNIVVDHYYGIANFDPGSTVVSAQYTLFEGNGTDVGPGIASTDEISGPAALRADYHLDGASNAINQVPALAWVTRDIDGDRRPMGPLADVGADEYVRGRAYLPLVLRKD